LLPQNAYIGDLAGHTPAGSSHKLSPSTCEMQHKWESWGRWPSLKLTESILRIYYEPKALLLYTYMPTTCMTLSLIHSHLNINFFPKNPTEHIPSKRSYQGKEGREAVGRNLNVPWTLATKNLLPSLDTKLIHGETLCI